MTWKSVKDYLMTLDNKQLVAIIGENYKLSKTVKYNLELKLLANSANKSAMEDALFKEYAQTIYEGFFPKRGTTIRLSKSRKALQDFIKLKPSDRKLLDIKLAYLKAGTEFVDEYGDMSDSYFVSALKLYREVMELATRQSLLADYYNEFKKIDDIAMDRYGYGYGDEMHAIFQEFYPK